MQLRDELLQRGFVVGSIDYPLIPLASGQEMVNDAKCAVRFLRAHASVLGINPQRIGVYGDSEGGYIASMLGTTGTTPIRTNLRTQSPVGRAELEELGSIGIFLALVQLTS
jgi:acetyl esterase/lipase